MHFRIIKYNIPHSTRIFEYDCRSRKLSRGRG